MTAYGTDRWKQISKRYRAEHPDCEDCGRPAEEVDHVIPRRLLIERGIHDPDHDRWLQSLCSDCHHSKSATHDGALGRPVTPIEER